MTRPANYRSALDDYFPRDPAAPVVTLAEAVTTPADMTGQGGLWAETEVEPGKPLVDKVGDMICALGQWPPVAECGEKMRRDLRNAARWVLGDVCGDLDKIERTYKKMVNDDFEVKVCHSASNPFTVARRMYAVAAKLPRPGDDVSGYLAYLEEDTPAKKAADEKNRMKYLEYLK